MIRILYLRMIDSLQKEVKLKIPYTIFSSLDFVSLDFSKKIVRNNSHTMDDIACF